jgi:membrane protein DedA with SNARE-associated domain
MTRWFFDHPDLSLFGISFMSRLGVPIPADPFLLMAGAAAGAGQASLGHLILAALLGSFLADFIWFEAGRRRGAGMLRLLCRLSLEPDSCVRRTEDLFARHGVAALFASKFVPALSTVAAPMAGIIGMGRASFSLLTLAATLAWVGILEGAGFLLSGRLEEALHFLARTSGGVTALIAILLALYLLWKVVQRKRFIRSLRIARITPRELKDRMDGVDDVFVVDLRHPSEVALSPETIPGALRMSPEELDWRHPEIPRGKEVVLVCT